MSDIEEAIALTKQLIAERDRLRAEVQRLTRKVDSLTRFDCCRNAERVYKLERDLEELRNEPGEPS